MKYQKLKRNLYTACVVANLFLIPSPVLWAEQSYAQSTRLSWDNSNYRPVDFAYDCSAQSTGLGIKNKFATTHAVYKFLFNF